MGRIWPDLLVLKSEEEGQEPRNVGGLYKPGRVPSESPEGCSPVDSLVLDQ